MKNVRVAFQWPVVIEIKFQSMNWTIQNKQRWVLLIEKTTFLGLYKSDKEIDLE